MQKSIYIENNTWARGDIWNFSSKVLNSVSHERAHISTLLTRRSRLNSRFKKRTRCHSLIALHWARDMSAADWLFQTHVKNYRNFSTVVIRLFSEVEIPTKHSIICTCDKKCCFFSYNKDCHSSNAIHGSFPLTLTSFDKSLRDGLK